MPGYRLITTIAISTALPCAAVADDWPEVAHLIASDGQENDHFGFGLDVDGETAIVGAYLAEGGGPVSGAAYVFEKLGGAWTEAAKLVAPDPTPGDLFGISVALDGDTAIIGAAYEDDGFFPHEIGAAYVFERIDGDWTYVTKLTASDGGSGDHFGWSVAISGETAVVGAPDAYETLDYQGQAYIYRRVGGQWVEIAALTAPDAQEADRFGYSVAIGGTTAVIGMRSDGPVPGKAYVFEEGGGLWNQIALLTSDDPSRLDDFGAAVAIDGQTIAIGAMHDSTIAPGAGALHIFEDQGEWTRAAKLTGSDSRENDLLGNAVAVRADVAVAGAIFHDGRYGDAGAAYVFQRVGGQWEQTAKLEPLLGGNQFGTSVATDGQAILVGANEDDSGAIGSATLFERDSCDADFNGDAEVNTLDVLAFLNAWNAQGDGQCDPQDQDCSADFNNDGEINTLDVLAFLNAWNAGC